MGTPEQKQAAAAALRTVSRRRGFGVASDNASAGLSSGAGGVGPRTRLELLLGRLSRKNHG
jgi:hypothetical protein